VQLRLIKTNRVNSYYAYSVGSISEPNCRT
jgi:hypothetical protein